MPSGNQQARRSASIRQPDFIKVGGRFLDREDWSPEVLEQIKAEYDFPAPVKDACLVRVDLAATCPEQHTSMERVGIIARTATIAAKFADVLHKSRVQINCLECGKQCTVSGKSEVWNGVLSKWDGAT